MLQFKEISYEEDRLQYFEFLLTCKRNQLDYRTRKTNYKKRSQLCKEICFIEDAIKALERKTDEQGT